MKIFKVFLALCVFTLVIGCSHFKNLEKNVIGEGKHEELHILLKKFKKKYLQLAAKTRKLK